MTVTMQLSTPEDFRKAYQREFSIAKKTGVMDGIEDRLEKMAVTVFGPVDGHEDGFGPPAKPIKVKCLHCGDQYSSDEMNLAYRPHMQHPMVMMLGRDADRIFALWWCKNLRCDGAGLGFDIRPVRAA